MTLSYEVPSAVGQLVWCPADPALGVGVVTGTGDRTVSVKFFRLQEERSYTTRDRESALLRYLIGSGERVRGKTGGEHRVRRRLPGTERAIVTYELEDGSQVEERELVPEIRDVGPRERLATLNLVHPEVVRARAQGLDLAGLGRRRGEAAILGGRVEWLPHQIDVATRAIGRDPVRMLLADEVGLGKTVEAALIYAGLRSEGRAARVLILTPDSLCIQWLGELYRKVHELFVLLDDQRLEDAAQDFPEMGPFEAYRRIVASIDKLAGNQALFEHVTAARWDLVIVDEAHHLRWRPEDGGNAAYRMVEAIAANTRNLLLLTATPMALDPAEYHALLRLLDPVRFEDPARFEATTKRVELIREVARAVTQAVDEGKAVGRGVAKAAAEIFADDEDDGRRFLELVEQKPDDPRRVATADEVLASLRHRHGLAELVVRNRRGPVGGLPERRPQVIPLRPTEKQAVLIEVGEQVMLELARTIDDRRQRHRTLGELLRALWATPRALSDVLGPISPTLVEELRPLVAAVVDAPKDSRDLPTGDARLRWLVETIRTLDKTDKLLVFVETGVAVAALKEALEPFVGNVATFHRGLSPRDQDRQVAWVRDTAGPMVMLSTEAGGEGRNFQFCHRVVLYDLPWRPATIEQRIGRVDRVGQRHDVIVLVPHFGQGYEAAILKVMQESIAVLDRTVGGIDPVLEYVSDDLARLILDDAGVDKWKALFRRTEKVVREARERIDSGVDPILDHASFSRVRVKEIMARVPADLEAQLESFAERYAECAKLTLHSKGKDLWDVEGGPSAAGHDQTREGGFVATFSRLRGLDHEDVEFLCFGHPLIEQALEWAAGAVESSAAVALCRGFEREGAVFIWRFAADLPEDVPEGAAYLDRATTTVVLDEASRPMPELEGLLLDASRPLDRMDVAGIRTAGERWRRLVEQNYEAGEKLASAALTSDRERATVRLDEVFATRKRDLLRAQRRELGQPLPKGTKKKAVSVRHAEELAALHAERERIARALAHATPRLVAAMAVRMMRAKAVSA
ncbi:MAG: DEAD/DEAH box helicase family protein [Deltaproteobacteria bacterium]|nr:DEAD/DEAH box helicase family protein [Deltaproteobacteria bacterium]